VSPPVRGFALTGAARACTTPEGAYANCLALSARYTAWLREQGEPAGIVALLGSRRAFADAAGRWPLCPPAGHSHWVTVSGGWAVDWTRRQFEPGADWPATMPAAELADAWRDVRVWACERCPELVADPLHEQLAPAGMHLEHRRLAGETDGRGPFPDPRHERHPSLEPLCACDFAVQP
jgi:hypothetical protein